jgi:hypothetical protein
MLTSIVLFLLMQQDPVRQMDRALMLQAAREQALDRQTQQMKDVRRQQFEQRFNKLLEALQRFSSTYKKGQGQVWPSKEAEAVRKAYREWERSSFPGSQ